MCGQIELTATNRYTELDNILLESRENTIFLVCGNSIKYQKGLYQYFSTLYDRIGVRVERFSDFQPNPLYESVVDGVRKFKASGCNTIIAVGGGSTMDVAKCIKLYSGMNSSENYLHQTLVANDVKLVAIPTTAGSGSEATRFAVIYYKGVKQSINDSSIIPSVVLFAPETLNTLSDYQKKATLLDALSHAIESFWSVSSTDESKEYSKQAIHLILNNMKGYIAGDDSRNADMIKAAYYAGKAINITQTTAGHAMCYKLTSLYGIAHGHAAALVNIKLWPWMTENTKKCIDPRGEQYLRDTFDELSKEMGCKTVDQAILLFQKIFDKLGLEVPEAKQSDFKILDTSVNLERLKNNPVRLDANSIDYLYHRILAR